MLTDLRDAIRCLEELRTKLGVDPKILGIAIVTAPIPGLVEYQAGEVVITKRESRLWTYTIEVPLNQAELAAQKEGSLNLTKKTMVGVPEAYLNRLILSDFDDNPDPKP